MDSENWPKTVQTDYVTSVHFMPENYNFQLLYLWSSSVWIQAADNLEENEKPVWMKQDKSNTHE